MRIPLQYQRTEYDCGPTTLLNGISYLFPREQVPPELLQHVMLYCLDSYNGKGERGRNGTSHMAMRFVAGWLCHYGKATGFPLEAEYLAGAGVSAEPGGRLSSALGQGGAAVVRVWYGCAHYVLLTGFEGHAFTLWDPYYRVRPFRPDGIELIAGAAHKNRLVALGHLQRQSKAPYALGPPVDREAVLLFNKITRRPPEESIEYCI